MKEAEFQRRVTDMATRFGWKWWHVPAPMRAAGDRFVPAREAAGLPDLILLHDDPPRMVLAEVKGDGGKLSVEQTEFLRLASNVAQDIHDDLIHYTAKADARQLGVYVFTPDLEDTIEAMLRTKVLL